MKENRSDIIRARLSSKEKEIVRKRAEAMGVSLSTYLRKCVLSQHFISKTDIQIAFEIKKIGTNLNQLAKHINTLPVEDNIVASLDSIDSYIKNLKLITDKLI